MGVVWLLWLASWSAVIGIVPGCPEQCNCKDNLLDCANKQLLEVPKGLPSTFKTFSLSANKITSLKFKDFVDHAQLTSLWLAHNQISGIERGTFAPLVQLRNLDLSNNKITAFPWGDFTNLTSLQMLKINNNEMAILPKDAFTNLKDLRSLRINNNRLATIQEGTFDPLVLLSHLHMYHNPFTCSCKLEWMRDWIAETQIAVPETDSITCEAPELLRGALVAKMPKLECKAPTVGLSSQPNIENTEIYAGFMLTLVCEAKGNPRPDLKWEIQVGNQYIEFSIPSNTFNQRPERPLDSKKHGDRFLVFQNGTLVIPRISKMEDGNYSCQATNEVGKAVSSVRVVVVGTQKHVTTMIDSVISKNSPYNRQPGSKTSINSVIESKGKGKTSPTGSTHVPITEGRQSAANAFISNHAFNLSTDELKQYTFDFGVIALEVSEKEAKVQLNPLQMPSSKATLHLSSPQELETINKEPLISSPPKARVPLDMLYICIKTRSGHSVVTWSKIEDGVNTYRFSGLQPGTSYTLCLTYGGMDCHVQVVFTTRKKIPSLLIIVVVSVFLLALATVPLLGATCCHLLYKYQGKTYRLIMRAQNPDQLEKHMASDFDQATSFAESDKNYNNSEPGEGDRGVEAEGEVGGEEEVDEGDTEGSMNTDSIPESQSKTNQEEFEAGSEYSDRLPLGAEAVNISEINGNYKQPSR
ncbi:hypothetical protein JZ751_012892 [Albula glossodonta]|uniref:Ig-like domain-containing protein n=1 Tax=Albula glossodonta TaxID=121402 RepID=A0A8T2MT83_9TELE|nr:hypothetical protein JZ751_012892 [Albula glossodonta]